MLGSCDSPVEGTGFKPSVPLLRKALLGVANRRWRHERRRHLQVQARDGNVCLEWLPIAFPSRRDREFESVFLLAESANHRFLSVGAQSAGNVPKRRRSGRLLSRLHDTRPNQALGICT